MRPEAAESAEKIKTELAQAAKDSQFKETLDALSKMGKAGREIASGIETQMQAAAIASGESIDDMVERLRLMDPAAAAAAEKIKAELAAADAASKFDDTLRELQKLNPEAAKAAGRTERNGRCG